MKIEQYYVGSLYAEGITEDLPDGLYVGGSLYLMEATIKKLPKGLKVGQDLFLEGSAITELPEDLTVKGDLLLKGSAIKNYPLVHNCGIHDRTIYLDLQDKSIIHIGCFKGTMEEALEAIKLKYDCYNNVHYYNNSLGQMNEYCNQVKKCFKLWEEINGKD